MSNTSRVRYGRVGKNRYPKNTLVTMRNGDTIYFGVSRCNNNAGDSFDKSLGTTIAANRATLAAYEEDNQDLVLNGGTISIHRSGLRGSVALSNITTLLNYFDNIDTFRGRL